MGLSGERGDYNVHCSLEYHARYLYRRFSYGFHNFTSNARKEWWHH